MTGLTTVIRKELKNLAGSGPGVFVMYALITALWSIAAIAISDDFWFIIFAAIIATSFSGTVFISERVSGTLEILITSGFSRDAVLFGKMAFVVAMTAIIGLASGTISCAVYVFCDIPFWGFGTWIFGITGAIYLSAAFFNAATAAYLSVRMSNPRFMPFVCLLLTSILVSAYYIYIQIVFQTAKHYRHENWLHWSQIHVLILTFLLAGTIFTLLARREFAGERITRPVIF